MRPFNSVRLIPHGAPVMFAALSLGVAIGVLGTRLVFVAPAQAQNAARADNEYQVGAVLWQQSSGEWRALSYQAFALARMMLDRDLGSRHRGALPRAIVVDVDETIMDNSVFQATLIKQQLAYDGKLWTDWVNRAGAAAL